MMLLNIFISVLLILHIEGKEDDKPTSPRVDNFGPMSDLFMVQVKWFY